jgi:NAD(P)H-dependent FMN reductase
MPKPRLVAFAGSLRQDSYNWKLVRVAAAAAQAAGAEVQVLTPADLEMPLLSEDLERDQGMPAAARRFKRALVESQGYLIASPEYNSSLSSALKNAIDWATRAEAPGEPPLLAFQGKAAGLLAASPGLFGGLRGLNHLTSILINLKVLVHPDQRALGRAHEAFDANGQLKDAAVQAHIAKIAAAVVQLCQRA